MRPFFHFIFFYFVLSFSFSIFYFFISSAFWFQIKSNQLVKFSRIQNFNARQQVTYSHDKTSFQENFTNLTKMVLFAECKIGLGFSNNSLKSGKILYGILKFIFKHLVGNAYFLLYKSFCKYSLCKIACIGLN
jgi:hypothetical protein